MMAASSQHCCVFVGNIPYDATQEQLIQICEEVGPVVSFRLVVDRETGKPKGYGFCEYKDEETALSARRNLQGYEINGRQLRVDFAENDKGSDRNREQGRGGPGLSSSSDALKPLGGATNIGDPTLHQPIGLTFAAAAASSMAAALGGPQSNNTSSNPNVFQSQPGPGSDSLTHYLSKMTKSQLYEVMSEMKVMATKNKVLARQLLLVSPQLPKALFQAQLMLGLVRPQMLQMPNIRQSSSSIPSQLLQDGPQDQQVLLTLPHGQTPSLQNKMNLGLLPRVPGPVSTVPQNALISQLSSALPPSISIQPHFQQPQQVQPQVRLQAALPGPSGVSLVRPQQLAGLPVQPQVASFMTSTTMKQEVQPPLLQHPRPAGAAHTGNTQIPLPLHPSLPPRPLPSQATFQPNSSNPPPLVGGVEMFSRDSNQSNTLLNLPLGPVDKARTVNDMLEPINHPSKLPRSEDGGGAQRMTVSGNDPSTSGSMPIRLSGAGSISANQTTMLDGTQQSEEKILQVQSCGSTVYSLPTVTGASEAHQLPPEVESALLQQVMSLTSEQLSSLSPEQRQQVIQLQQMLR